MRFRNVEIHKKQKGERRSSESRKRALPEVGRLEETTRENLKRPIQSEWRSLVPFIEAYRSQEPRREYLESFWSRFLPRLKQAIHQDSLVRQYRRATRWRRWAVRLVAAAALMALAWGWRVERGETQLLREEIARLQQRLDTSVEQPAP